MTSITRSGTTPDNVKYVTWIMMVSYFKFAFHFFHLYIWTWDCSRIYKENDRYITRPEVHSYKPLVFSTSLTSHTKYNSSQAVWHFIIKQFWSLPQTNFSYFQVFYIYCRPQIWILKLCNSNLYHFALQHNDNNLGLHCTCRCTIAVGFLVLSYKTYLNLDDFLVLTLVQMMGNTSRDVPLNIARRQWTVNTR